MKHLKLMQQQFKVVVIKYQGTRWQKPRQHVLCQSGSFAERCVTIMNKTEFRRWLLERKGLQKKTVETKISQCATVELYEGDLDNYYELDKMVSLISKFQYSRDDERKDKVPRHSVPINGNIYNGNASYRAALKLYHEYREFNKSEASSTKSIIIKTKTIEKSISTWPMWKNCSRNAIYTLAVTTIPYIVFLSPCIIEAIEKKNRENRGNIIDTLRSNGILRPELYIWDGSPCAWPGVRRYVGNSETKKKWRSDAGFKEKSEEIGTALYIDDNDMPKQIWAFTFTGTYFRKKGPDKFSLAHLIDHKKNKNRMPQEFSGVTDIPVYGLFSSAANSVFIDDALMKPTDGNEDLRKLLYAKAISLYKDVCNVVPSGIELNKPSDYRFDINNPEFKWSNPEGDLTNFDNFMEYRRQKYIDAGYPDMYF